MANLNIVDSEGKEVEKLKISDDIVKQEPNPEIIYHEVRRYLAALRSGTHNTKGRSEVRGGGKKPWRQKGTGNARAGTNSSPIWRGGGIVFGPKPRDYSFKLNKKVIKKSKLIALSEKFREKKFIVVDKFDFDRPSTKKANELLKKLNIDKVKALVVVEDIFGDTAKSFRNIETAYVESPYGLNAYTIINADFIVFSKDSLNKLIERLGNGQS